MENPRVLRLICPLLWALLASANHDLPAQSNSSIVVCEGGTAELECPRGMVISIALANYGRYSARVCYDNEELDDVVPMTQCHNPRTMPTLRKSCDGRRECDFVVDNRFFVPDPCPGVKKYLEVTYTCVVEVTTTTTTTTTATTTMTTSTSTEPRDDVKTDMTVHSTPNTCSTTSRRGIEWPATVAGKTVNRPCPEGTRGTSSWQCLPEGLWAEAGPNTMECQSDWTIQRQDALEETIKDQDASGIPELLRAMTSDTRRPMVAGDLPKLLNVLDVVQDIVSREPWARSSQKLVNQLIVNVVHNTLRAKEMWQNWPLAKRQTFATRLLTGVERAMTSASVTVHSSENYVQPLVMTEMSESIRTSSQPASYFLFPSMALWAGENNVDSVDVPKEALELTGLDRSRVYYASFANIGDEIEPPVEVIPPTEQLPKGAERRRRIVSRIVAASIVLDGKSIKLPALPKPVIITFHHYPEALRRMTSPECCWWDTDDFKWSSSGCSLQSHNTTHTVCACNHMTHFAVLMDVVGHDISDADNQLLTFLTYAGCSLSVVCLTLTFFCFVIFVKGGSDRVFIHKNLCASLGIAELVFLAGIWRTEEKFECSVIAGCLLYFFLSALMWMLLEGYQLYQMLVEVFPASRRRLTFFVVGYGVPAVITGAAALYDPTGFGTRNHCWLRTDNLFILFFVAPAAVILLTNTLFLFMTMCVVYRHSKYIPCRHAADNGGDIRTWVKGAMGLVCLLGVTWTCGLLWIDDGHSIVMAYAFTITNSLQGLFIFLFHVLFSEKMRYDISRWCSNKRLPCLTSDSRNSSRDTHKRGTMSPSERSGSEFIYPSSEKMHSSPRGLDSSLHSAYPQQHPLVHHYQRHPSQNNGTYDYATIAYGEMVPGHMLPRMASSFPHPGVSVHHYPSCDSSLIRGSDMDTVYQPQVFHHHHRPPPDFSPPPPPPPPQGATSARGVRPPSSKMSDDSAYSDGGSSSVLTTEVTPSGATVLRMDLGGRSQQPPPGYWRNV